MRSFSFAAPDNTSRLWYRAPAQQRTQALPIGNGRLGAALFGGLLRASIEGIDTKTLLKTQFFTEGAAIVWHHNGGTNFVFAPTNWTDYTHGFQQGVGKG